MDLMGRMGRAFYVRCSGQAIHTIVQDYVPVTIGYDQIPPHIKSSSVLTGNDLGKIAGLVTLPDEQAVSNARQMKEVQEALAQQHPNLALEYLGKNYLDKGDVLTGTSILMIGN
jgi:hypothetical protein